MSLQARSTCLFETIKILDHEVCNLDWHIQRAKNSVSSKLKFDFASILKSPFDGLVRAKVIYTLDARLLKVQFYPYKMRDFRTFKLVSSDISYEKKWLDRSYIQQLKGEFDEIIIVQNSLITDTSIANIAIFDESSKVWISPRKPLLLGTTRARLAQNGFIKLRDISQNELLNAKRFAIMNAMMDFQEIKDFEFQL